MPTKLRHLYLVGKANELGSGEDLFKETELRDLGDHRTLDN